MLLSVGQKASLVEAINALYFDPTFDPDLTTPPGKGVITLGKFLIESIAVSHASKHDFLLLLSTKKFPPPIAGTLAVDSSHKNSPSITGILQYRLLLIFLISDNHLQNILNSSLEV